MAVAAHRALGSRRRRSGDVGGEQRSGPPALSQAEERVLAALSHRPLGLYPAASVAVAAGVGREEAVDALQRLVGLGLVTGAAEPVPSRPVRHEVVWRLDVAAAWRQFPDVLRFTDLPRVPPTPMPQRLPERFAHLFWWSDTSLYELPRDAAFVAEQILESPDVTSWGWALFTLPCDALELVARKPHVSEGRRDLIINALAYRRAEPAGPV
jgi:hypothetical protein